MKKKKAQKHVNRAIEAGQKVAGEYSEFADDLAMMLFEIYSPESHARVDCLHLWKCDECTKIHLGVNLKDGARLVVAGEALEPMLKAAGEMVAEHPGIIEALREAGGVLANPIKTRVLQ